MRRIAPGLLALIVACGADPRRDPPVGLERLEAIEATAPPLSYAEVDAAGPFDPRGVYLEDDVLWVWSSRHRRQVGYRRVGGAPTQVGERTGPAFTRRCVVGPPTVCVGEGEPGGVMVLGRSIDRPARAGWRDGTTDGERLFLLDAVDHVVEVAALDGSTRARVPIPPPGLRMGRLGPDHLWVLSGAAPYLAVIRTRGDPARIPMGTTRAAPFRDAAYDAARDLLWLVGPHDRRVRRTDGPLVGLKTELVAVSGEDLRSGLLAVVHRFDLAAEGGVDGSRVVVAGETVAVSATGSDRIWTFDGTTVEVIDGGLAPAGLTATGDGFAWVSRLDDRLRFSDGASVALDDRPRTARADLGERLFYGAHLWRQPPTRAYTCNGCHWDGGTDHRLHPGFLERRFEITRSLAGIGAVAPLFTTGGAPSLGRAVEGLVRSLDPRLWEPGHEGEAWWRYPIALSLKGGGEVELTPAEVRAALLDFLLRRPVRRGPLRRPDGGFTAAAREGAALFARDCARCHEPTPSMRDRRKVSDVRARLERAPLVFGSPAYAEVGAGPDFTSNGNRISPLLDLARGGPFFASGAAATLEDVLRGFRPEGAAHGGGGEAFYSREERAALRAFLLSM